MIKKLLPLFLFVFLSVSITAQTTVIADANFEQFLVDEGIDTNGVNGNILDVDAQAVTNLDVTRNDITDFAGLEAFVNLITLDLGLNDFATAPLTTLTLLEELIFDDNDVLASLDLTQNINLKILNIGATGNGGTPPITTLDISQNTMLVTIYIYAFTSLADIIFPQTSTIKTIQIIGTDEDIFDFTNHSGLEELWLNQNRQTTNITLPAIKNVLKKLDIRNQTVSSIDLSGFIVLEDINLGGTEVETLLLPGSPVLRRLTISRHKLPSVFSFATEPNLEILHVTSNLLTTAFDVNITTNTSLYDLDLSDNKMVNLDMTQNTLLTDVDVSNNTLVTFDTSQNLVLEDLDASRNVITNLDLSQNVVLEDLNLNTNELPTIDLATNIELETLNLGTNQLPNLDITPNTKIRSLYIDNNLFSGTGLDLTQNVNLSYLNAEINQIESLDITQNLDLSTIILNYNLFPGTAILDQFYTIRSGDGGIRGGTLEVSHNLLTGQIPNFADLFHLGPADTDLWTRYFELTIDNNYFHFADLEIDHIDFVSYVNQLGAYNIPIIRKYQYAPQAKVNAIENPMPNAGESITLITDVRGAQNHYQWFKDGVPIVDATDSPEYTITDLNTCDNGVYHAEITSDLVPFENANPPGTNGKNLLLVRNDITLTVNATKACVTLDMPLTDVPINSGIQWNDNPGACGYKISLGTTSGATDLLPLTDVGEVNIYNHTVDFLSNQDIFVTIIPYYDDGDFTCTEQSFRTNTTTIAPECTVLSSSLAGRNDVAIDANIEWQPANGADTYDISIGTFPMGTDIFTGNVGSDLFYNPGADFVEGATIYVTIVPRNAVGPASGCLEESFMVESSASPTAPICTSITSPAATNAPIGTTQMTWNAVPNATGYRITITGTANNNITNAEVTTNAYPFPGAFVNGETATVTIVPFNGPIDAVGCSDETFTVEAAAPLAPVCTSITSPVATDAPIGTTQMTWNTVSNATGYRITITGTTNNNITDEEVTTNSYPFTGAFVNGETATVTIIPFNGTMDAVGCNEETFTIEAAVPLAPICTSITSPAATEAPIGTTQMTWNAVPNATGYRITITGTMNNNVVNEEVITNTYPFTGTFVNGETATVSIVPFNGTVDAVGCSDETFTIEALEPVPTVLDCSGLITPENESDGVAVDTTFEWESVDNADSYQITIGTLSGGNDILDEDVGILTSYTLSNLLEPETTYYINIIPSNSNGNQTDCLEQSFTTGEEIEEEAPEEEDILESQYGFSPDGDGINEFWEINGIENYPNNTVTIYNRWGDAVFRADNYDNGQNVFRGEANMKTNMGAGALPAGTYFFDIQIEGETLLEKTKGFVVIKR